MSRARRRRPQHVATQQMTPEQARAQLDAGGREMMPIIRGREIDAGDLSGEYVEPVTASFTYFGKRFRVNPDLTETMVVDLLEKASEIEVEGPEHMVATKDYVREHLHPEDFDDFWDTVKDNRQSVQAIIKLCWLLLEQVTERPTTPPSDSSDGRRDTPTNSPDGASALATASSPGGNLDDVAAKWQRTFEEEGRPDKALQIELARQHREAQGLVTV